MVVGNLFHCAFATSFALGHYNSEWQVHPWIYRSVLLIPLSSQLSLCITHTIPCSKFLSLIPMSHLCCGLHNWNSQVTILYPFRYHVVAIATVCSTFLPPMVLAVPSYVFNYTSGLSYSSSSWKLIAVRSGDYRDLLWMEPIGNQVDIIFLVNHCNALCQKWVQRMHSMLLSHMGFATDYKMEPTLALVGIWARKFLSFPHPSERAWPFASIHDKLF